MFFKHFKNGTLILPRSFVLFFLYFHWGGCLKVAYGIKGLLIASSDQL